jgi:hypothetical protein
MQTTLQNSAFNSIIDIAITELGLTGLACLATSSKSLRDSALSIVHDNTAGLLERTIDSTGG